MGSRGRCRAWGPRVSRSPSSRRPSRCSSRMVRFGSRARRSSARALTAGGGSSRILSAKGKLSDAGSRIPLHAHTPPRRADHDRCSVQLIACVVQRVVPCIVLTSSVRSPMSNPVATTGAVEPVDRETAVRALSEQVPRFMRLVHALKTQAARNDSGDRAALVLLFPLVRMGPLRQGALAELVHADPSTVSRHVAALVERGLVQRVADESDGRASRLHVTDAGHAALDAFRRDRENHFAQVTAGWDAADLLALTTLLGRFLDDMSRTTPGAADSCAPGGHIPEGAASTV